MEKEKLAGSCKSLRPGRVLGGSAGLATTRRRRSPICTRAAAFYSSMERFGDAHGEQPGIGSHRRRRVGILTGRAASRESLTCRWFQALWWCGMGGGGTACTGEGCGLACCGGGAWCEGRRGGRWPPDMARPAPTTTHNGQRRPATSPARKTNTHNADTQWS